MVKLTFTLSSLFILFGMFGCSAPDNELGRRPVSGKVTFGGELLESGSIDFSPTGKEGTQSGAVIENGEYEIPEERGLPPGEYLVRITSAASGGPEPEAPGMSSELPEELIPASYNTESDQKVTVKSDEPNNFIFDIPESN